MSGLEAEPNMAGVSLMYTVIFCVQLLLVMLVWLTLTQTKKIPDSRFADAIKFFFFFLFTLHNKSYVNLANYLSACAAYTKYQQRSAFYYTGWFSRHSAVRLIQWTLNIINSKRQNTMGQYPHVTSTRIMTFSGRSVQCLILYLSRMQFSSNPRLLFVRKYQGLLNRRSTCNDAIFPPALFLFITKPHHENSKVEFARTFKRRQRKLSSETFKLNEQISPWGRSPAQTPSRARSGDPRERGKSSCPSQRQQGGRVERIRGLVAAAAAPPVGFGAGLGRGRWALGLQHAGVREDEAGVVRGGHRSGSGHHRSVQTVSVRAIHATT